MGGGVFNNVHSAQSSARAWEISGRVSGSRFDGTNIENWLGLSNTTQAGKTYDGDTYDVDTFFLLIGTNDLLSDGSSSETASNNIANETYKESVFANLLGEDLASGDIGTIVDAMYASNADASVTILSVPCWTLHANNNGEAAHAAVAEYNANLQTWVSNYNEANGTSVKYVDINAGLIDVAATTSFYGVASMFRNAGTDGLHPNAQGDLIIAGNLAKALGYAGRTAGQERRAASEFSTHVENFAGTLPSEITTTNTSVTDDGRLDFSAAGESTLVASWAADADLSSGFTVDFSLVFGNGSEDGWDTETNLSVTLGDGSLYGTLNINEAYIQWGDTILYSTDTSALTDALRVAYVVGNATEGLSSGFYVWLDDMLIGEALTATVGNVSGVTFSYAGTGTLLLESFSMDGSGSYAPTTTLYTNAEAAYIASAAVVPTADPQGEITFPSSGEYTATASDLTASGTYNARAQADTTGGENVVVGVTVTSGATTIIYANSGAYTGDVWATVEGGSASSWYGAHGGSGDLNGDVGLRLTGDCTGGSTVFGAVNAGTVYGNVYLDISAENATFNSFTSDSSTASSVVGAYNASIAGTLHVQISAGTFNYKVYGGLFSATSGQSIGQTEIYVNGGTFNGNVYGGGREGTIGSSASAIMTLADDDGTGTVSSPAASVTVTGGELHGNVFGGGAGDTIYGDTAVVVTGGSFIGGSSCGIYGGGSAGTINGNTSVTIDGNVPQLFLLGSGWAAICGGGSGGTISGDATVALKNVSAGDAQYGVDKYAGTISGGTNVAGTRTLILDNVSVSFSGATLADFDVVSVLNGTATALSSLGGASTLEMDAGTTLDLSSATDLSALTKIVLGENAALSLDFSLIVDELVISVDSTASAFSLIALNGAEDMDLSRVSFLAGDKIYAAVATVPDAQAGTVFIALSIPEPSAFAPLAGTLALALAASRRRRRRHAA